jgi:uncharacterized protein YuzE
MRMHYDAATDSLYINLGGGKYYESEELEEDLIADFDKDGKIVGLDIQHASGRLDLTTLEADTLPLATNSSSKLELTSATGRR